MGARVSTPTAAQRAELEQRLPELLARAACAIRSADVLLVCTGAGWSADSGLAVYRDVADVAAYHERNLTYRDICVPRFLDEEPSLFYGFWGSCFNDYRETSPHEGYSIIRGWVERHFKYTQAAATMRTIGEEENASGDGAAGAFFAYTSNVDAHWQAAGFAPHEIYEIHGNTESWQCQDHDCHVYSLPTPPAPGASGGGEREWLSPSERFPGRWKAPPGYRFAVDDVSRLAADGPPGAAASAAVGSGQPHDASGFAANWPRCVRCGAPARPAVLMFGDSNYVEEEAAQGRWAVWSESLVEQAAAHGWKVAILEVGCGGKQRDDGALPGGGAAAGAHRGGRLRHPLAHQPRLPALRRPHHDGSRAAAHVPHPLARTRGGARARRADTQAIGAVGGDVGFIAGAAAADVCLLGSSGRLRSGGLGPATEGGSGDAGEADGDLDCDGTLQQAHLLDTGEADGAADGADAAGMIAAVRAAVKTDDDIAQAKLERARALLARVDACR